MKESLLVAMGGNATHPESIKGTTEEQEAVAETAARALLRADLERRDQRFRWQPADLDLVRPAQERAIARPHDDRPHRIDPPRARRRTPRAPRA